MNGKSRQRVPFSLQAVFIANNRGQERATPPPGNVACRVFQSILHRSRSHRTFQYNTYNDSTGHEKFGSTVQANDIKELHKPTSNQSPTMDRDDPTYNSNFSFNEIDTPRRIRNVDVDHVSASANATTISCNVDSDLLNVDHLYSSPKKCKKKSASKPLFTPQSYLDATLEKRGYSTDRFFVHESGYHNRATGHQQRSYHPHIIDLVKANNVEALRSLFDVGLSTNPANAYGEGLINLVCRIGAVDVLKLMIHSGCDIQVSDDYGRTPLHDACWSAKPSFEIVELLLTIDPSMIYMMDVRGSSPLSYVPERDYDEWIRFFMSKLDVLWPRLEKGTPQAPPSLTLQLPNNRPIKNPHIELPPAFIEMLASGRMNPDEAKFLLQTYDEEEDLNSFVDEEFSTDGAFEEGRFDDSTSSSVDEALCLSGSCHYDDVSVMSVVGPVDRHVCGFRPIDNIDSVTTLCDRQSHNVDVNVVSPHVLPSLDGLSLHDRTDCSIQHPIFPMPPFCEFSDASGDASLSGCDPKVFIESNFSRVHPRPVTGRPCDGVDGIGSTDSNLPAIVQQSQKGTYCRPDDDSGLLFGSC